MPQTSIIIIIIMLYTMKYWNNGSQDFYFTYPIISGLVISIRKDQPARYMKTSAVDSGRTIPMLTNNIVLENFILFSCPHKTPCL